MIHVEHVAKYFGDNIVLRNVEFSLAPGEFVGLVGPSGGGKSVLLKLLGKIFAPDSGQINYEKAKGGRTELTTGFLFQEGALFDSLTVLENVAFPILSPDTGRVVQPKEAYAQAYDILGEVGLSDAYRKVPGQLSGGMRRRVALARALVTNPELVLLDDPTGGLDPVAASVIMELIRSLHERYRPTVVIVSHDIRRLLPSVERVIGLFGGVVACDLAPHDLAAKAPREVVHFLATRFDFDSFDPAAPPGRETTRP